MANETKSSQLFIPEVSRDMLNEVIEAQLKITRYAKVDKSLVGAAGNTVKVPKWDYIGMAEDTSEGDPIAIREMGHSSDTYTIKKAAIGVKLTQEAINDGAGDPKGTAIRQLGKSIAEKVEDDIFKKAYTSSLVYDGTSAVISYNGIVSADSLFQDEEAGNEKVMFIHPLQYATLLKDDNFKSKDKYDKSVVPSGAIGQIGGIWIKKSARVKTIDVTAGSRTVTIAGTVATGDKYSITVGTKKYEFTVASTQTATAAAAGLVAAITADTAAVVSAASTDGVITLTEATGNYGKSLATAPTLAKTSTSGTITGGGTYSGMFGYESPIIKLEADSKDTEYSDTELPGLTIFLKKDASVVDQYVNTHDIWNITATKYYGVALTNGTKVAIAKFKAA